MGAISSINFCQTEGCHVPENSTLPSHGHETLKSHTRGMSGSIDVKACDSMWCLYASRVCQVIQIVGEQKHLSRCVATNLGANVLWYLGKLKVCNETSASKLCYFWLPYEQVFRCLSWLCRRTVYSRSQMSDAVVCFNVSFLWVYNILMWICEIQYLSWNVNLSIMIWRMFSLQNRHLDGVHIVQYSISVSTNLIRIQQGNPSSHLMHEYYKSDMYMTLNSHCHENHKPYLVTSVHICFMLF